MGREALSVRRFADCSTPNAAAVPSDAESPSHASPVAAADVMGTGRSTRPPRPHLLVRWPLLHIDLAEAVARCHGESGPRYVVAAGCEVPRDTPEANVLALREYARSHAS